MLTKKMKSEIINNIVSMSDTERLELLRVCTRKDDFLYNEKLYIREYKRGKWSRWINLEGYYIYRVLKIKIENDAPRGGMQGEHVIIKDNKLNRLKIDFIKKFLEIY